MLISPEFHSGVARLVISLYNTNPVHREVFLGIYFLLMWFVCRCCILTGICLTMKRFTVAAGVLCAVFLVYSLQVFMCIFLRSRLCLPPVAPVAPPDTPSVAVSWS